MPRILTTGLSVALLLSLSLTSAHAQNPEDNPIPDEDTPTTPPPAQPAPAQPAPAKPPGQNAPTPPPANTKPPGQNPPPAKPITPGAPPLPTAPLPAPPTLPSDSNEAVTLTRAQLNALLRQQAELQRQIDELKRGGAIPTPNPGDENPETPETPATVTGPSGGPSSGTGVGNTGSATDGTSGSGTAAEGSGSGVPAGGGSNSSLLLPDISFIGQAVGLYSTDKRAEGRSSFRLSEGEIGIQGYVYPGVKADAFITGSPTENEAFQLEETYLTFLGVRPGLNIYAGRKFVPFGRTGEQHNHSWLYARQLLPRRNLIAEEALTGDGVNFRYNRPFGKLYTQADFGIFSGEGPGETALDASGNFDPLNHFGTGVPTGTGAGFTRRFYNSRFYAALPTGANSELALGTSYARGRSEINGLGMGNTAVSGVDATYRTYLSGGRRVLARAEYFGYNPGRGLGTSSASGYYGLLNYRLDARKDVGLLYEESGFPQAPGQRETATSLIYTKQFTEQFYARLHAIRGDRPSDGHYNEVFLQFVFGLGPHTHSLE